MQLRNIDKIGKIGNIGKMGNIRINNPVRDICGSYGLITPKTRGR